VHVQNLTIIQYNKEGEREKKREDGKRSEKAKYRALKI
jgi:hypothetical protein